VNRSAAGGRRARLRLAVLGLVCGLLVVVAGSVSAPAGATPAPVCVASVCSVTFAYTGAADSWTVPAGVTSATFDLYGAQGGGSAGNALFFAGLGGELKATLAVSAGTSIQVTVGGQGAGLAAGFNGGGGGGFGGGGASDIRVGGTGLADRKLVAGGGGGAGRTACVTNADGGAGGGVSGSPGNAGCDGFVAGGGGTQTTGGTGGGGGVATDGAFGVGGSGSELGGGGGGGWYGGGGGNQAGGGGGSSYPDPNNLPAGVSNVTTTSGVQTGDGQITITYTLPGVQGHDGSPVNATEGLPVKNATLGTFTDTNTATAASAFTATVCWNDTGAPPSDCGLAKISGSNGSFTVTGSHTFLEEGSYTAVTTVTGADGTATINTPFVVADAPIRASGFKLAVKKQKAFTAAVAAYLDTNLFGKPSDLTATINWGDSTSSAGKIAGVGPVGTVVGTHTYAAGGTYTLTVTITDVGGSNVITATTTIKAS
jgi:hypothetical protein